MRPSSRRFLPVLLVATLAGACGTPETGGSRSAGRSGGGAYGAPRRSARAEPVEAAAPAGGPARLEVGVHPELGAYLAAGGRALYLFAADGAGTSTCTGACAEAWPPLLTEGAATLADATLAAELVGSVRRDDGTMQVTYAGWPLYRYAGDAAAGETTGHGVDGFGAEWWLVSPEGRALGR
jgi:predicted lipoprotein with Yx(FWY)xxD motif